MSGTSSSISETWNHHVWDVVSICADVDDDVPDIVSHVADMDLFGQNIATDAHREGFTQMEEVPRYFRLEK